MKEIIAIFHNISQKENEVEGTLPTQSMIPYDTGKKEIKDNFLQKHVWRHRAPHIRKSNSELYVKNYVSLWCGISSMFVGLPQHWKIGSMNDSLREDIALIISIDVERAADKM